MALPYLVLDVGQLRAVLVVLLVLQVDNRRIQRSFHGWWFHGNSFANYTLLTTRQISFPFLNFDINIFKNIRGHYPMRQ